MTASRRCATSCATRWRKRTPLASPDDGPAAASLRCKSTPHFDALVLASCPAHSCSRRSTCAAFSCHSCDGKPPLPMRSILQVLCLVCVVPSRLLSRATASCTGTSVAPARPELVIAPCASWSVRCGVESMTRRVASTPTTRSCSFLALSLRRGSALRFRSALRSAPAPAVASTVRLQR
jgi:hypothetical protein